MKNTVRILVTGGRDYHERNRVRIVLERARTRWGDITVVHGGCPTGLDALANHVAREMGLSVEVYRADWDRYGNAAGPIRNSEMVASRPDILFAFPGGRGTRDCETKAVAAGIDVLRVG